MARTKQVARKSCAQKIPRKKLAAQNIVRKSASIEYVGAKKPHRFRLGHANSNYHEQRPPARSAHPR